MLCWAWLHSKQLVGTSKERPHGLLIVIEPCGLQVRYIEFSDQVFGQRFQPVDTMQLQIDGHPVCTLKSTDSRAWMTQFGPARRGGGSCLNLLEQYPMPLR